MFEFAARNNIEAASEFGKMFEDGKVAIRFHCKAQRMRHASEPAVHFAKCVGYRCAAIDISRRLEFGGCVRERHPFTKNLFTMRNAAGFALPAKMRTECGWIYNVQVGT